jgi:hypothetical protein
VLEWGTAQLLGTGEFAMRFLPAVASTLTVVAVYAATALAANRGAALAAAVVTAANPFLVWYGQDARAYALLILLVALALLCLVAYEAGGGRRALVGWALASAAAMATHYFAVFVIAPQAVWLVVAGSGDQRQRVRAVGAPLLTAIALLPLALHQRSTVSDPGGLGDSPLGERLVAIPKNFMVGFSVPAEAVAAAAACALAAVGIVLAVRRGDRSGRAARLALGLAMAGVLLPLVVAPFGFDYVSSRNVVAALVPLAIALGCGYAVGRTGAAALTGLVVVSVATVIGVAAEREHQRRDWKRAAEALGPARTARVLVFSPSFSNPNPFRVYYGDASRLLQRDHGPVGEIAVVALAETGDFGPGAPKPPEGSAAPPPRGFEMEQELRTETYRLIRYRTDRPRRIEAGELVRLALPVKSAVFVWQPAGTG